MAELAPAVAPPRGTADGTAADIYTCNGSGSETWN
jgi:hypothetical protein